MTRATSHTLLWKDHDAVNTLGPLTNWQRYDLREGEQRFRRTGTPAALNVLAAAAIDGAIAACRNVTIARQVEDPEKTPASTLLAMRPVTVICPERAPRPGTPTRWIVAWLTGDAREAKPESFPETIIQATASAFVKENYPVYNQAPSFYSVPNLALRHDVTAEELGIIERQKVTPDMIVASVADDPEVSAAISEWDRATPSTYYALVRARLKAQEHAGVPEAERAPLYSGQVEEMLTPLLMRMGKGDEADVIAILRRDCVRKYRDFSEVVLRFMLATYRHGGTEGLLRVATAKAAA